MNDITIISSQKNPILKQLIKQYTDNTTLFSVEDLFKKHNISDKKINLTLNEISQQVFDIITEIVINDDKTKQKILNGLVGYKYIDELDELVNGRNIKTICINKIQCLSGKSEDSVLLESLHSHSVNSCSDEKIVLKYFGVIIGKSFNINGTLIRCIAFGKRFISYRFDNYLTFQQLSIGDLERLAYEAILKKIEDK